LAAPLLGLAIDDVRPDEQKIEFWIGQLSRKWSGTPQWERWRLHGANIYHIQQRFASTQIGNANIALPGLQLA